MLITYLLVQGPLESKIINLPNGMKKFPKTIGKWENTNDLEFPANIIQILKVSDYLNRNYYYKDQWINLYVGYFAIQKQGEQIHSPKHCLPGSGWEGERYQKHWIPLPGSKEKGIWVNKYIVAKGNEKNMVLYWFQSRGRKIANEYMDRFYLVWDAIFRQRTDGALVRIIVPFSTGTEKSQSEEANQFARYLMPILDNYLPS